MKKQSPKALIRLCTFTFKPVYTFEVYGNSNEHLNGRYDTNPIFDKNAYMLDVNFTGLTSNLSDITEGYELWLLDDMTLAVTYFYNMKVRSKDKFEAVTYRYFMKNGLYKFGYDFEEDAFLGKIEYNIAKELCCNTECDNKCDECEYDEIISGYEKALPILMIMTMTLMRTMMSASVMNVMIVRIRTTAHSKMWLSRRKAERRRRTGQMREHLY